MQPDSIFGMSGNLTQRSPERVVHSTRTGSIRSAAVLKPDSNVINREFDLLRGLAPLRLHILRRLVETDVLVDMVDPGGVCRREHRPLSA